jgi:predicted RecA/RadA family phage recombinase
MAKNFIQEGDTLLYSNTSGSTITSGTAVLMGSKVGIALVDISNNASGAVAMEGVWSYAKNTGASTGGLMGASAYWDNSAKKFTAVSSGNTLAGYFAATCADGDATCQVKLMG